MTKKRDDPIFWSVVGFIVMISGFSWLGKEVGWWAFNFPFWPTIFVWMGIAIVITSFRKLTSQTM